MPGANTATRALPFWKLSLIDPLCGQAHHHPGFIKDFIIGDSWFQSKTKTNDKIQVFIE